VIGDHRGRRGVAAAARPPRAAAAQAAPGADRGRSPPQLFFAKVPRTIGEEEVVELFGRFGTIAAVNLFRAFLGAPTTKVRKRRARHRLAPGLLAQPGARSARPARR
jgi:hypothetical protein